MKQYKDTPYYVDDKGNVYRNGRKLKPDNVRGYHRVTFSINGKTKRHLVHKLVAELYIPNPENKPNINHIDNVRNNNYVSNLEWCTHSENMLHCTKQGRGTHKEATEQSVINNNIRMEKKFTKILGDNYFGSYKFKGRRYIKYCCFRCKKPKESRSDSEIFKKLPYFCVSCKDEDIV